MDHLRRLILNEEEIVEAIIKRIFSAQLHWKRPTLVYGECPSSETLFDKFATQLQEKTTVARTLLTKTVDLDLSAILDSVEHRALRIGTLEQRLLDRIKKSAEGLARPFWYAGGFETEEHKADFEHWLRMKWWDLAQATALSIGFEPRHEITFDPLGMKVHHPARSFYEKRRDLIRNNFQTQHGCFIHPIKFCEWAVSSKLPVHIDLLEAANVILETKFALPDRRTRRTNKLENRERVALLKLVIGMAVKGYSFDPSAKRSRTPQEICDDLALLGLTLDVKTIRKYLAEGTRLIPDGPDRE